eukprot:Colp12_sorted_trinity150504_noHs@18048
MADIPATAAVLEKRLSLRPDAETLLEHGVLKSTTVAPALQAAQDALAKERTKDLLVDHILHRPHASDIPEVFKEAEADKHNSNEAELAAIALKLDHWHRPEQQELVDRNILHGGNVAPSLQQAQDELKKRKIEDTLNDKLSHRPEEADLVAHNILKSAGTVAPALQQAQEELKKKQLEDTLNAKISHRPDQEELIAHNILKGADVAPAIAAAKEQLEKEMASLAVEKGIKLRPEAQELVDHNILKGGTDVDPKALEEAEAAKRKETEESLAEKLAHRPSIDALQGKILP